MEKIKNKTNELREVETSLIGFLFETFLLKTKKNESSEEAYENNKIKFEKALQTAREAFKKDIERYGLEEIKKDFMSIDKSFSTFKTSPKIDKLVKYIEGSETCFIMRDVIRDAHVSDKKVKLNTKVKFNSIRKSFGTKWRPQSEGGMCKFISNTIGFELTFHMIDEREENPAKYCVSSMEFFIKIQKEIDSKED